MTRRDPGTQVPPGRSPGTGEEGPTELVRTEDGQLVERLSAGTATLLLAWLIGIGAGSALLALWVVAFAGGVRLGVGDLFSSLGFYVAIFGASGPCILWLAGRAQGRRLAWWLMQSAKIGLLMIAIVVGFGALGALAMGIPIVGVSPVVLFSVAATIVLSMVWALATWAADLAIARARLDEPPRPR
jgi:hypothetical protein